MANSKKLTPEQKAWMDKMSNALGIGQLTKPENIDPMADGGIPSPDGDPMKMLDVSDEMMKRRDVEMTDAEVELFHDIPERAKLIETR